MKPTIRLSIALVVAAGCHAALIFTPKLLSESTPSKRDKNGNMDQRITAVQPVIQQVPKKEKQEEIAARVTTPQNDLEMNGGNQDSQPSPTAAINNSTASTKIKQAEKEENKEEKVLSKEQSLQKAVNIASEEKKEVIDSSMTAQ